MQRNAFVRALVAVCLVLLAGCSAQTGGDAQPESGSGPVQAQVPVELRPVLSVTPSGSPGPDTLVGPDGTAYTLGPSIDDFARFDNVRAENQAETGGGWVITIDLPADTAKVFGDWTAQHVNEQLAIVVDGKLLSAPTIQSAILGGSLQISGTFTEKEAKQLAEDITGK